MPHTEPSGHKHDFYFFDLMGRNQTREEFCHFMNNLVRSIVNATSTALTEGESQVRRQFLRHGPPPVKIDKAEVMRHCAHYFSNTTAHAQTKNNNILSNNIFKIEQIWLIKPFNPDYSNRLKQFKKINLTFSKIAELRLTILVKDISTRVLAYIDNHAEQKTYRDNKYSRHFGTDHTFIILYL